MMTPVGWAASLAKDVGSMGKFVVAIFSDEAPASNRAHKPPLAHFTSATTLWRASASVGWMWIASRMTVYGAPAFISVM